MVQAAFSGSIRPKNIFLFISSKVGIVNFP